jgi:soluble lytic murein transglycosylase-like protein
MNIRIFFISFYLLFITSLVFYAFTPNEKNVNVDVILSEESKYKNKTPISLVMYEAIEKYSEEYDIPKYVAYNVAYRETRYRGPFDWNYNPKQTSCVGALGPMQIMPRTSYSINKVVYSNEKIKSDIELNVRTSMKLLRKLHNKYNNWSMVCGHYNTGRSIVNEYGRYCGTNFNYKSKWVELKN